MKSIILYNKKYTKHILLLGDMCTYYESKKIRIMIGIYI